MDDKVIPIREHTQRDKMVMTADLLGNRFTEMLAESFVTSVPANKCTAPDEKADDTLDKRVVIKILNDAIFHYHRYLRQMTQIHLEMTKEKTDSMSEHVGNRCRFLFQQICFFVLGNVQAYGVSPEEVKWF